MAKSCKNRINEKVADDEWPEAVKQLYIYVCRVKATEQWRREKMEEWLM